MRWEEHGPRRDGAPHGRLPVIMLHGIPTHPRLYRYVIPRVVAEGSRSLAWELVGFGGSMAEGLERDISMACQASYLAAWLDHFDIERAVFVGHDLGGGVLQRLALANPRRCAGLVLADVVAYDNWLGPAAFAHQLQSLDKADTKVLAGDLGRLSMPARVIWGERDALSLASAERLAAELHAPLQAIPGGRHFTPESHPDVIASAVSGVLAEVSPGTAGQREAMSR